MARYISPWYGATAGLRESMDWFAENLMRYIFNKKMAEFEWGKRKEMAELEEKWERERMALVNSIRDMQWYMVNVVPTLPENKQKKMTPWYVTKEFFKYYTTGEPPKLEGIDIERLTAMQEEKDVRARLAKPLTETPRKVLGKMIDLRIPEAEARNFIIKYTLLPPASWQYVDPQTGEIKKGLSPKEQALAKLYQAIAASYDKEGNFVPRWEDIRRALLDYWGDENLVNLILREQGYEPPAKETPPIERVKGWIGGLFGKETPQPAPSPPIPSQAPQVPPASPPAPATPAPRTPSTLELTPEQKRLLLEYLKRQGVY